MALKRGIVELEKYNNIWKVEYEIEKNLLKKVLRSKIKEIHHVGSTAIDGLEAKPIIDILIAIESLDDIQDIENILKDYDYSNRGHQGVEDRYFFAKGPEDSRTHYIHFVEKNSNTYYNLVYFKKYLLEHPEYIKKYCDLKKELSIKYSEERAKYTAGKSEFIKEVISLAKNEYDD